MAGLFSCGRIESGVQTQPGPHFCDEIRLISRFYFFSSLGPGAIVTRRGSGAVSFHLPVHVSNRGGFSFFTRGSRGTTSVSSVFLGIFFIF
jgi:hypothetical protein